MKRTIYVVDDQSPLVELVVLALGHLQRDWEVSGFTDPSAVLEAVKAKAPDAVLSDHVMPKMQGSELLEQVRALAPATVRLIMSGCVPLDKLALITTAHQFIAKPFEPSTLRDLIQRSFAAQDRIKNQGLQTVATSIRAIPSLPQAHQSLLKQLEDEQAPGATIARLIGADPGLSVKVLQLANSGLFGRGNLVTDLIEAVNCLGTEVITAVLLTQSAFRHYEPLKNRHVDMAKVWAHSWETGCIAQRLCREQRLPHHAGEEAFLAGLLHEVGRFILVDNFPEKYQAACEAAVKSRKPPGAHLREVFQATPTQLSAYVLDLWGLPASVVQSISHLDTPEEDPAREFSMTTALYIAEHLATRKCPPDSFPAEAWKTEYLKSIGCPGDIGTWEKLAKNPEPEA